MKRIYLGEKKLVFVRSAEGSTSVVLEVFGKCPSCPQKLYLARARAQEQWIPVIEKKKDEHYELHRCDGELKRNPALRALVSGRVNGQRI